MTVLLIVGLMRVTWSEKGPGYYWHDLYFMIKFGAFLAATLISIYPTAILLSWTELLKAGGVPEISQACLRRVRMCMMLELTAHRCHPAVRRADGARLRHSALRPEGQEARRREAICAPSTRDCNFR
ncbi:MAG: DUF2214 family protein [Steroidobacteraceae bacterium]